ncbi:hypothetical protein CYPRO_3162 [Cyclonatronum proteinivorum]|uniref:Uncharacterized protein n=1 Tax=Cyclonatronum proteinivorum TaxID=1457365 RepID=A0A345UPJ4_9BACT|nr:hypothetical protein [Cyclonatronum proteinivorum]AXJ02396.1 hypothetical protein CYPRO_3162 [Cyclonatronum proteinivorum]
MRTSQTSQNKNEESSRGTGIVVICVLLVSVWQLILLMLFQFDPQAFLLSAVTGMAIATSAGFLALYFSEKPHRVQGVTIVVLLAGYLQVVTLPHDRFEARPLDEFRAAAGLLLQPEAIQADILFQRPRAPFALATAAVHKYQDDLPEHSWFVRFHDDAADSGHLINIRSNMAASSHPAFRNARIIEDFLVFEIEQYGEHVLYRLPLSDSALPFTIFGTPLHDEGGYDIIEAQVYPHILSPAQQSHFHILFFRLLNLRFR